jgi:saccharopine dehydrogenase-like NADP-dependent oxidoreductase
VFREYMVKVRIIKDGMITEVDATSGREASGSGRAGWTRCWSAP